MSARCVTGLFDISGVVSFLAGKGLRITCVEIWWWSATVACLGSWLAVSLVLVITWLALWVVFVGLVAFVEFAWIWVFAASAFSCSVGTASSVSVLAGLADVAGGVASVCVVTWVWSAVVFALGLATKAVSWVGCDALSSGLVTSPAWAASGGIKLITTIPWVITNISTSGTFMSIMVGNRNMAPTTVESSHLTIVINAGNIQAQAVWASEPLLAVIHGLSSERETNQCS